MLANNHLELDKPLTLQDPTACKTLIDEVSFSHIQLNGIVMYSYRLKENSLCLKSTRTIGLRRTFLLYF